MTAEANERELLSYAGACPRAAGEGRGPVLLVAVNIAAAAASLLLVPLASHIYSCSSGQKWCHLQAFLFGVPAAFVVIILAVVTAGTTLGASSRMRHTRALALGAWLPLAVAASVLVALFVAVAHNS